MSTQNITDLAGRVSALSEAMADRQNRFLADLIRIRSYTGQEKPAVERTLAELRAIGCDEVWQDSAGNALGRIGRGPRVILYNAHLDTNEVADESEWPHPPLEPVVEGDTMFGLGVSDCKGGVAAIVYGAAILAQLRRETFEVSANLAGLSVVIMGATLEEDAEGFALRSLVERDSVRPDVVLLAEATDLTLRRGQRGRCEVRVRTEGRAAHASQPHLGESAILKMLPVIAALEAMNGHLPVDPIFGAGNQVVTLIEGPHTPNSVPSWCEVAVDRRLVPGESAESVLMGIRSAVEPLGATGAHPDPTGVDPHRPAPRRAELLPRLAAAGIRSPPGRGQGDRRGAVRRGAGRRRLALFHRRHLLRRRGGHPLARLRAGGGTVRSYRTGSDQPDQALQGRGLLRAVSVPVWPADRTKRERHR